MQKEEAKKILPGRFLKEKKATYAKQMARLYSQWYCSGFMNDRRSALDARQVSNSPIAAVC